VANSRQRGLGQEQAMFHLQAHHAAQVRRLQHQVECEALSLQALGFLEAQCRKLAVANVHARAMEGYLVWLQNRAEPQRDRQGRDKVEFLLGEARVCFDARWLGAPVDFLGLKRLYHGQKSLRRCTMPLPQLFRLRVASMRGIPTHEHSRACRPHGQGMS
ncbi:unnamed protein product, partial [Effrenium voratum]